MSERTTNMVVLGAALVALVVIVVGLASGDTAEPTAEDRVAALSEAIKCPFCSGESLAESPSGVAAEYRALIAERVAAGYTDEVEKLETLEAKVVFLAGEDELEVEIHLVDGVIRWDMSSEDDSDDEEDDHE